MKAPVYQKIIKLGYSSCFSTFSWLSFGFIYTIEVIINYFELGDSKTDVLKHTLSKSEVKAAYLPVWIASEEALWILMTACYQWYSLFTLTCYSKIRKLFQEVLLPLFKSIFELLFATPILFDGSDNCVTDLFHGLLVVKFSKFVDFIWINAAELLRLEHNLLCIIQYIILGALKYLTLQFLS